jgi:hypothetical protein
VRDARQPDRLLTAAELRGLYRQLAEEGFLLGQPVSLGGFGGLRLALGARDLGEAADVSALPRLFDALAAATMPAASGLRR